MDRSLYEEHARLERDHWWFVGRRAIVGHVLERHLPPDPARRVLDVGCGTGGMLPLLARFGRVRGIEAEPLAVEHCHEAFPGFDVEKGSIPGDVPVDGSYGLVTAFDVIEHIEDDLGALQAVREAVAPGGWVAITVPALMWLWSDHDVVNGHERRYTRAGLVDVVGRSGLTLASVSYFNTALLPMVAAARLAQRLRPARTTRASDFTMPSPLANRLLTRTMSAERFLVARTGLPIGVSLIAVASRPR